LRFSQRGSLVIFVLAITITAVHGNSTTSSEKKTKAPLRNGLGISLSIPQFGYGVSAFTIGPRSRFGWYIDIQGTFDTVTGRDDYYNKSETWAGTTIGDEKQAETEVLTAIHAGASFYISPQMLGFIAPGLSIIKYYAKYYDPLEILSSNGNYYVNGEHQDSYLPGLVGGMLIKLDNPYFSGTTISFSVPPASGKSGDLRTPIPESFGQ